LGKKRRSLLVFAMASAVVALQSGAAVALDVVVKVALFVRAVPQFEQAHTITKLLARPVAPGVLGKPRTAAWMAMSAAVFWFEPDESGVA
jgi:hypothetical protein